MKDLSFWHLCLLGFPEEVLTGLWETAKLDDVMQINELSLVEANQMSMAQMAGNMPGLSILKDAVEESDLRTEDQPLQEEIEAAEVIPHVSDVGLSHNFNPATLDLAAGLRFKKAGKKGESRPSIES